MAFLDEQGLRYIAQACDKKYLKLSGGTITGRISRSGGGKNIVAREAVAVSGISSGQEKDQSFNPVVGQKTTSGYWAVGNMSGHEELYFHYTTDANYQAGNNKAVSVKLPVPTSEDSVVLKSQTMTGATNNDPGESGLVPTPVAGAANRYLRSDGTWQVPPDTNTIYIHPTGSGNNHIPSGGSAGQILRWSSNGTAVWGNDNNTTYTFNSPLSLAGGAVSLGTVTVDKGGTGATTLGANPGTVETSKGWALNHLGICAGTASPPSLKKGCFYVKYSV